VRVQDLSALVTGGASGLGLAAARLGPAASFVAGDVTDPIENPYLNGETIRLDGAIRMAPR
jgi:hypothetical protein